jgi:hypothetical protein
MDLVKISVTTLEEFRRYKTFDYISEERMVDRIKGIRSTSPDMDYGTDFGEYIEQPEIAYCLPTGAVRMPTGDSYLPRAIVAKIDEYRSELQCPVYEVVVRAKYVFTGMPPIIISGRIDIATGDKIREIKTTRQFDYEGYEDSLQWGFYCDMLSINTCIYDVFEKYGVVDDPNGAKDDEGKLIQWPADVNLHSFVFYSYPEMKRDLRWWISEFMGFVQRKGLTEYLTTNFDDDKDFTPCVTSGENFFE